MTRTIQCGQVLAVRDITHFSFQRAATLECLIQRVKGKHYSTFCLYEADELERAIEGFEATLKGKHVECEVLEWLDENVMITVQKV